MSPKHKHSAHLQVKIMTIKRNSKIGRNCTLLALPPRCYGAKVDPGEIAPQGRTRQCHYKETV